MTKKLNEKLGESLKENIDSYAEAFLKYTEKFDNTARRNVLTHRKAMLKKIDKLQEDSDLLQDLIEIHKDRLFHENICDCSTRKIRSSWKAAIARWRGP